MPFLTTVRAKGIAAQVETRDVDGVRVFDIMPEHVAPNDRSVVLDLHGGGFLLLGGELCCITASKVASRLRRRVWGVDFRMPPDHPYPAGLNDVVAAYRALLREREPHKIIIHGIASGANLAVALIQRLGEEGLPLPAGVIIRTPDLDLTESGDSFKTLLGTEPGVEVLMPSNLLYADGRDLHDPKLSPLFGDFTRGFPPTLLESGTRDVFLSNAVRMQRALLKAGVRAELHLAEAGGHVAFPEETPEGADMTQEIHRFIRSVLVSG